MSSSLNYKSLYGAVTLAKALHGLTLSEADLQDYMEPLLNRTAGELTVDLYLFSATPDKQGYLKLPCLAERLVSVRRAGPVYNGSTTTSVIETERITGNQMLSESGDTPLVGSPGSVAKEQFALAEIVGMADWYDVTPQPFVPYQVVGNNRLQLSYNGRPYTGSVDIKYTARVEAEDGYPLVHSNVVEAMATFANMNDIQKRYWMQEVPENMLMQAKAAFIGIRDVALCGEGISENGMAAILNEIASFDRVRFNSNIPKP